MSQEEFEARYGRWAPLTPTQVRDLLAGAPFPWWIAGGWAVEAATGVVRPHDDVDVAVLASDLAALRSWFSDHELHETRSGDVALLPDGAEPTPDNDQLWLRRGPDEPWLADLLLTPTDGDDWLFKRDRSLRRPLRDIGWVGPDGVPYLRAEIVLLFKAKLSRDKDQADLSSLLDADPAGAVWLVGALERTHPGHPWIDRIRGDVGG